MPKVSHLHLFISAIFLFLGCSSFQGPGHFTSKIGSYRTPASYSGAGDFHNSLQAQNQGPLNLRWPVEKPRLSRGYRPHTDRDHEGIDIRGWRGKPILSAHDGVVVFAGRRYRGYGNMIIVEYNNQWATLYAHLSQLSVQTGDRIHQGQRLGKMGRTGRTTGVHLHFELIKNKQPIDPLAYLEGGTRLAER